MLRGRVREWILAVLAVFAVGAVFHASANWHRAEQELEQLRNQYEKLMPVPIITDTVTVTDTVVLTRYVLDTVVKRDTLHHSDTVFAKVPVLFPTMPIEVGPLQPPVHIELIEKNISNWERAGWAALGLAAGLATHYFTDQEIHRIYIERPHPRKGCSGCKHEP